MIYFIPVIWAKGFDYIDLIQIESEGIIFYCVKSLIK